MIRYACAFAVLLFAGVANAQSITIETIPLPDDDSGIIQDDGLDDAGPRIEYRTLEPEPVLPKGEIATGAVVRALDKVSGETTDAELGAGQATTMFALDVGLTECRYPAGNPAGDAFAYLVIREADEAQGALFAGWMVASSPALSALDHARYDVWVLRCITS